MNWEAKNTWISDSNHPRTIRAQAAWSDYVYENPKGSITDALSYVDEKLGLSNSNPMKTAASVTSTSGKVSRSTSANSKNVLNWDSLSPQEIHLWNAGGKRMWKNDKSKFLKSVSSSRSDK